VVPAGRSKPLQSADGGVVRELRVREGQAVRAGELLLRLDAGELRAEHARVAGERHAEGLALAVALARLGLLGQARTEPGALARALDAAFGSVPVRPDVEERELQLALLAAQQAAHLQRADALVRRDAARDAERRAAGATALEFERSLPILDSRAAAARRLAERGMLSREQTEERELALLAAGQQLAAARERERALAEERGALGADRAALVEGERRAVLDAVAAHRRALDALDAELVRLGERLARHELRAPVDGVVQQLAVRAPGAVVRPAEPLLVVVPRDAPLEVEAWVSDRDIGFVRRGQQASVKVEAFDFSRYGLVSAHVNALSAEAVQHERLGRVYAAQVGLERGWFQIDGSRVALAPGMAVQVEVRTGRRRIIDYFLSPIARVARDSIRER
jgi:hemolysin D